MAGYTYAPSTIITEIPIPIRRIRASLNLAKEMPYLWSQLSPQEQIQQIIIEQRFKNSQRDPWESLFDSSNWSDDDDDEHWLQSFLADAPINDPITEAELDDMFDQWREQMADDEWIRYMTEYEYNQFCCVTEGGY